MLGGMDRFVVPIICAAVGFGIKGNKSQVDAKLAQAEQINGSRAAKPAMEETQHSSLSALLLLYFPHLKGHL